MSGKAKGEYARSRSESEPEEGAESDGADAKPSDLRMDDSPRRRGADPRLC